MLPFSGVDNGTYGCRANLKLQRRLAASILKAGKRKVWLDPNEAAEIGNANSRMDQFSLVWH